MHFVVELFISSGADLERLFDFLLDQAETTNDLELVHSAVSTVRATMRHGLAITPFSVRKAARHHPAQRSAARMNHSVQRHWVCQVVCARQHVETRRVGGAPPL